MPPGNGSECESFVDHKRISANLIGDREGVELAETLNPMIQVECERCGYGLRFGGEVASGFFR